MLWPKQNKKSDPRWDPRPYTVTARKGTMVTASREGHVITRNASYFKPYHYLDDTDISSAKVQVSLAPLEDPPRDQTQTTQAEVQTIPVAPQPQPTYTQTQTSTP
ncbi:Retrovirus-related Pol poly from transposon [Brachionus plicatilis]|uniref:Retrovirus-related Pol poly from transposon n=1 Tax=Brachionus plicatilis TaxID=10195 RepID=A0A3M7RGC6_BRAPC|nr:Retrovirus-related Pol poly from transposon [Brachionus plicatilis]